MQHMRSRMKKKQLEGGRGVSCRNEIEGKVIAMMSGEGNITLFFKSHFFILLGLYKLDKKYILYK